MEAVVVVPAAMLVVLIVVQMCLWAHAEALVQSAAAEGDRAACDLGGSMESGVDTAREFLASTGTASVVNPQVVGSTPVTGQVEVTVRGMAEAVVPWLHLTVSATRRGDVQGFRPSE